MNDQSLAVLGLSRPPFSKEIPDADLWMPSSKQTVVDELVEALEARQSALLVGEPGVGKSCVLRALRKRLPGERFRLTYCHNATLGRRDFYRQLCLALGLSPKATAASLFFAVYRTFTTSRAPASTPSSSWTRRTCFTPTCSGTFTSC